MRSRNFLFILCFCLPLKFLHGQTTFSKLYWNYPATTLGLAIALSDENIYVVGRGASYVGPYLRPNVFFSKDRLFGEHAFE